MNIVNLSFADEPANEADDNSIIPFPSPVSLQEPLAVQLLPAERDFYSGYEWSLNAYPTIENVVRYLREELARVAKTEADWRLAERMLNISMLASAISNEVDDCLVGTRYDFSKAARVPLGGLAVKAVDRVLGVARKGREWRLRALHAWNRRWLAALDEFLQIFVAGGVENSPALEQTAQQLANLLDAKLPQDLRSRRLRNPAFYHVRDLTHVDVLKLGEKFVAAFPDRSQPIVLVGLRTAGSYFNPLLRAYFKNKGYQDVDSLTVRPRSSVSSREKAQLATSSKAGRLAVITDEPACSGGTTAGVAKMLYKAGFPKEKVVAMFPVHYQFQEWGKGWGKLLNSGTRILTLEPEEWHKNLLLQTQAVQATVEGYFLGRGYVSAQVRQSAVSERYNAQLQFFSEEKMHTRLKRVYEVRLQKRG